MLEYPAVHYHSIYQIYIFGIVKHQGENMVRDPCAALMRHSYVEERRAIVIHLYLNKFRFAICKPMDVSIPTKS